MNRLDRVNKQLQKEISIILQKELNDPRVTYVSITHVDVSPDLRKAKVMFSLYGEACSAEEITHVLDKAKGRIRKFVGNRVRMRYTPELWFVYDDSMDSHFQIDAVLKEISHDHEKNH
jgi:ribosome-binding factor A